MMFTNGIRHLRSTPTWRKWPVRYHACWGATRRDGAGNGTRRRRSSGQEGEGGEHRVVTWVEGLRRRRLCDHDREYVAPVDRREERDMALRRAHVVHTDGGAAAEDRVHRPRGWRRDLRELVGVPLLDGQASWIDVAL